MSEVSVQAGQMKEQKTNFSFKDKICSYNKKVVYLNHFSQAI
jgi:hypothetical protein